MARIGLREGRIRFFEISSEVPVTSTARMTEPDKRWERVLDTRPQGRYNSERCGDDRLRRGRLSTGSRPGRSGPVNNGAQILSANEDTWMNVPMAAFDTAAVPVVA